MKVFEGVFPDDDVCLEWLRNRLYPKLIYCLTCKRGTKYYRVRARKLYACGFCGRHVSPMAGTIFRGSSTPLKLWFYIAFLMGVTKCGMSVRKIQRETGVTLKTAWRMSVRTRSVRNEDILKGVYEDTMIGAQCGTVSEGGLSSEVK